MKNTASDFFVYRIASKTTIKWVGIVGQEPRKKGREAGEEKRGREAGFPMQGGGNI